MSPAARPIAALRSTVAAPTVPVRCVLPAPAGAWQTMHLPEACGRGRDCRRVPPRGARCTD
jgi:hypothetical protein